MLILKIKLPKTCDDRYVTTNATANRVKEGRFFFSPSFSPMLALAKQSRTREQCPNSNITHGACPHKSQIAKESTFQH